jgi:hypothetical protein
VNARLDEARVGAKQGEEQAMKKTLSPTTAHTLPMAANA